MGESILLRFKDGPLSGRGNVPDLAGALHTFVVPVESVGGWPPPRYIVYRGDTEQGALMAGTEEEPRPPLPPDAQAVYVRLSHSAITDEQAAEMTHVARGAEYELVEG